MNSVWYLTAIGCSVAAGIGTMVVLNRRHQHIDADTTIDPDNATVAILKDNKIRVLQASELLQHLNLYETIQSLQDRTGFNSEIFNNDCIPVIQSVAEWVQLLPASESHHHAQPGGLLSHVMETTFHALRLRQGYLLPVGAPPEEIPEKKHRWTYAVFLAALLHDIGKPVSDINVSLFKNERSAGKWHPLAGSMLLQGASHYTIDFELTVRGYDLHQKLPIILMQRFVPPHVLSWLASDVSLMNELSHYLSGDTAYSGILKEIVTKADGESVKNNLLSGPRTRFAVARTVPLIERLMQALRMMLEEGRLKLNQAGAHGWVYDGKLWFVSKRIADEVRQFILERESSEGIPGKDKNDRLFDTWQEYGAIITNAQDKAVWSVKVELEGGWEQTLTVICFPLDKLFKTELSYPNNMRGRIVVTDMIATEEVSVTDQDNAAVNTVAEQVMNVISTEAENSPSENIIPVAENPEKVKATETEPPKKVAALPSVSAKAILGLQPNIEQRAPPPVAAKSTPQDTQEAAEYLDDNEVAKPVKNKRKPPEATPLNPVAPTGQAANFWKSGEGKKKEPSAAALRFIRWVQEGLAQGELAYNRADAMIHFIDDGMMLVSPVIFRRFAELFGEAGDGLPSERTGDALGTGIQRQVINAGWHKKDGDKNILKFTVVGYNGEGRKIISGVVITDPVRFVNPLPDNNPSITPFSNSF